MKKRKISNKELLRTARGFMRDAPKHSGLVEIGTADFHYQEKSLLYDAEKDIDSKRLTWGKS